MVLLYLYSLFLTTAYIKSHHVGALGFPLVKLEERYWECVGLGFINAGCVAGPEKGKMTTWLVGHSFVHWAVKFAEKQVYGRSLGLPSRNHEVRWWGESGMRWGSLLPFITSNLPHWGCPDLLLIHLGENDLVKLSGLTLIQMMQRDLELLKHKLCGTCLIWTEFVPRRAWRGAINHGAIERARKKLNRAMRVFCWAQGIKVLRHGDIKEQEKELFRDDGVHLSQLGNVYYITELRLMLESAWGTNLCTKE
ncbi:uncharacterized protein [Pleurodeles waltl]|uniref:uncharacterized protein isoform X2 n=1 Tax=Pleurodeles waltl TaxID=8319 RepID=UPI0037097F36